MSNGFFARPVRYRLIACIGVVAGLISPAAAAQSAHPRATERIDRDLVRDTVESLATVVRREYMDAETAGRVDASLRKWLAEDRYAGAVAPDGIQRVEILPGNIGYVNITWFYRPNEARQAISAAMQMLRNADALILDLRGNGGGSPETVALVASYLFDTLELPLFEIVPRSADGGQTYRTEAGSLPDRDGRRPLYTLTSERTFSGGEGLAFILQERKRAEVVGETTAGAANPGRPYPLNARFAATVPNGKVQSAIRRANWEGTGVTPDVKTPDRIVRG